MLKSQDLVPLVNRLLAKARRGVKLPNTVNDDNFIELLTLIVDIVAPQDDDDETDSLKDLPLLNTRTGDIEMSASLRGRNRRPSRSEISAAKLFMLTGQRLP